MVGEGEELHVGPALTAWRLAFEGRDADAMVALHDPVAITVFDDGDPVERRGVDALRARWAVVFAALDEHATVELSQVEIAIDGGLAVVRLVCRVRGRSDGRAVDVRSRRTLCFHRLDGRWAVFHEHASGALAERRPGGRAPA